MAELFFDDTRLDDPGVLQAYDPALRQLALCGSRIRVEAQQLSDIQLDAQLRPRGVIVVGAESRLLRAVIETTCPVPLVAWPFGGLPGWVGPLDLVVVLASNDETPGTLSTVVEARRRGCSLIVAAPEDSRVAHESLSRVTTLLPTRTGDPLASCVVVLSMLAGAGLGPQVRPEETAESVDMVAESCSPHRDLSNNPAKDFAMALADAEPLVWGGSLLAARASRRVAEALRRNSGRPALAADASELIPVMRAAGPSDPFADPFDSFGPDRRPVLVILDDAEPEQYSMSGGPELESFADAQRLRIERLTVSDADASPVTRYATLLQQGRFGASYLGIGLGCPADPVAGYWQPGN
jgi:hypothetical protein